MKRRLEQSIRCLEEPASEIFWFLQPHEVCEASARLDAEIMLMCKRVPFWLLWCLLWAFGAPRGFCGAPEDLRQIPFDGGPSAAQAALVLDPVEGMVLTWQARSSDGHALQFAVYDAGGSELRRGLIASGAHWFVNWADFPSLLVLENGDWLSFYLQRPSADSHAYGIRVLRSQDKGRHWGPALIPHGPDSTAEHGFVSMVALDDDRALLFWLDGDPEASDQQATDTDAEPASAHADHDAEMRLRAVVLGRQGPLAAAETLDERVCSCCQTAAVRIADQVWVVYRDRSADEIRDISYRVRGADGRWSETASVHDDAWRIHGCPVNGPAIAASSSRVLVVWPTFAEPSPGVRYRIHSADGCGPMFELERGAAALGRVSAAVTPAGEFLIAHIGAGADGGQLNLSMLNADGDMRRQRVVAAIDPARASGFPRIAVWDDAVWVAWTEAAAGESQVQLRVMPVASLAGTLPTD